MEIAQHSRPLWIGVLASILFVPLLMALLMMFSVERIMVPPLLVLIMGLVIATPVAVFVELPLALLLRRLGLVGWIAAERRLLLELGERIEIVGLVVSSPMRRTGAGNALVAFAERWAKDQAATVIAVRSNVVRVESHPFYESMGYVRKKTQHSYAKNLSLAPARL